MPGDTQTRRTPSQRARARQLRLKAEGRCMTCGEKHNSGYNHCRPCLDRRNAYTQDYFRRYGRN
jgi:hypothetical protein